MSARTTCAEPDGVAPDDTEERMAKPKKDKAGAAAAGRPESTKHSAARAQIETMLARGQAKDAYKQAKGLYRLDAGDETRELLERCYLARIESLIQAGMHATAQETAEAWLQMGVRQPELLEKLVVLLPAVGLARRAQELSKSIVSEDARRRLLEATVDRAVANPAEAGMAGEATAAEVGIVRSALEQVAAGDDDGALLTLQAIPRQSPCADWRVFIRGLIAFYKEDSAQAAANWDRLTPGRAAATIAGQLRRSWAASSGDGTAERDLSRIETRLLGGAVSERFAELETCLKELDWKRLFKLLPDLNRALKRVSPQWPQRLTALLLETATSDVINESFEEGTELLRRLFSVAEPLDFDPRWNRAWGLVYESAYCYDLAEARWLDYLVDVDRLPEEWAGRRNLIKAVVWRKLARLRIESKNNPVDSFFSEPKKPADVFAAFDSSLETHPASRRTLEELREYAVESRDWARAKATNRKLVELFPDDVPSLLRAVQEGLSDSSQTDRRASKASRQKAEQAEARMADEVARLRTLLPLDPRLDRLEAAVRFQRVRSRVDADRFDDARRELDATQPLLQSDGLRLIGLALDAVLRTAAGEDATPVIERGSKLANEPTAFQLALATEFGRCRRTVSARKQHTAGLKRALKQKVRSDTATLLVEVREIYRPRVDFDEGQSDVCAVADLLGYWSKCGPLPLEPTTVESIAMALSESPQKNAALLKFINAAFRRPGSGALKSPVLLLGWVTAELLRIRTCSKMPSYGAIDKLMARADQAYRAAQADTARYGDLLPAIRSAMEAARELMDEYRGANDDSVPIFFRQFAERTNR